MSERDLIIVRRWVAVFVLGLVISGLTAIPLAAEANAIVALTGATGPEAHANPFWADWMLRVQSALTEVQDHHPMLFYGTDWLAFGHLVIAMAFFGAWQNPVRNAWLFDFGLLACALVIPWALFFGHLRGIPMWWRLIDCSFGILGAIPLYFGRRIVRLYRCHKPCEMK